MMPIEVEAQSTSQTIRLPGAVPVDVPANLAATVSMLMLTDRSIDPAGNALRPLAADERLIACDQELQPLAQLLFPGLKMIFIPPVRLTRSPLAWEAVDAYLTSVPLPQGLDAGLLVAGGMTLATPTPPDQTDGGSLPWQRVGDYWVARSIAPPIERMAGFAYERIVGRPALPPQRRRQLIAISSLLTLVVLATLAYRGPWRQQVCAGALLCCVTGLLTWRHGLDPTSRTIGTIVKRDATAEQMDVWCYWFAASSGTVRLSERPVPQNFESANRVRLRGVAESSWKMTWLADLDSRSTIAEVLRRPHGLGYPPALSDQISPLRSLAEAAYAGAGSRVSSRVSGESMPMVFVDSP